MSDPRREAIQQRLAGAAAGPWRWSRTYELYDEWTVGLAKHWCLHNPASDAKGSTLNGHLVLLSHSPNDYDGKPLDKSPDFELIANAPSDLAYLLERLAVVEAERDEAVKDSRRLDWLDEQREPVVQEGPWGEPELIAYAWRVEFMGQYSSLRTPIDEALAALSTPPPENALLEPPPTDATASPSDTEPERVR